MNGGAKPVDENGAVILNAVLAFLMRFVAYPSVHAAVAHALWIAHCHLMTWWESTPRLALLSPESKSGKTRALECTETMVPRPILSCNATPAYLFRKVSDEAGPPTILYDEIDTLFGAAAKDHEEGRGLINAGHRRGATAGRCIVRGKVIETQELPAYCAVALAGIGNLPDTITTRSVVIRMRRRSPAERIEPYRVRVHSRQGQAIGRLLALWAGNQQSIGEAWPAMPEGIVDRDADCWEPLLAVADAAGGDWPARARVAAVALVALSRVGTPSLGLQLLSDLRIVFGDELDAMATEDILHDLCVLKEAPWGDLRGKSITDRVLARLLKPYDIRSKNIRVGVAAAVKRGYAREDLHDPWLRYLGVPAQESATSATNTKSAAHDPEAEAERSAIESESGDYEAASRGE
jgi:hypothetical protein